MLSIAAFTDELVKLAQVKPYQQKTQFSCSAACLKAVLAHWGSNIPELHLIQAIKATKNRGAETTQIVDAAKSLGFDALEMSFDSLEQARVLTDQDIPILADVQSFRHPGKGHYVIITKIDEEGVHLMDPNTEGNQRVISNEEMDERWWDRWMKPPHELLSKWGVIVAPLGRLP